MPYYLNKIIRVRILTKPSLLLSDVFVWSFLLIQDHCLQFSMAIYLNMSCLILYHIFYIQYSIQLILIWMKLSCYFFFSSEASKKIQIDILSPCVMRTFWIDFFIWYTSYVIKSSGRNTKNWWYRVTWWQFYYFKALTKENLRSGLHRLWAKV